MQITARIRRTMFATLMCTSVAVMVVSPAAIAQNRGNSGLPSGRGNPMAKLQQEITALTQQVAALQTQMTGVLALQQQVNTLSTQVTSLKTQIGVLNSQVTALSTLSSQMAILKTQIDALNSQMTALSTLSSQMATLKTQIGVLNSQMIALSTLSAQMASLKTQIDALSSQMATSGGLGVFDANGKKVGNVVGVQDSVPWVGLTAAGRQFVLQVSPDQLLTGGFLWYAGPNCSGAAYIAYFNAFTNGPDVLSVAAVQEPGGVVYAAAANAPLQSVSVESVLLHDGTCFDYGGAFSQNLVPATAVMTLDSNFKRPYSVH